MRLNKQLVPVTERIMITIHTNVDKKVVVGQKPPPFSEACSTLFCVV